MDNISQNLISTEKEFHSEMVTFKNSKNQPFQSWFPYLEGYSVNFVKSIIEKYMPLSEIILDPFGGTVSTGFAASELGLTSYYCEINPALQFIAEMKIKVRTLDYKTRRELAKELNKISLNIKNEIKDFNEDKQLKINYHNAFNNNNFFSDKNFEDILLSKSYADSLLNKSKLLSDLFRLAVTVSLVPSSNLKRAGDLRYKTEKELEKQKPIFFDILANTILNINNDLLGFYPKLDKTPFLICENAFNLNKIPMLNIDGLVTSPPYVNGTNYFRNTKLELWYLGFLRKQKDLSEIRKKAVTSGINGVIGNKKDSTITSVQDVVFKLNENAYDRRIPKMVSYYFEDLNMIFGNIKNHLKQNSVIAIDIGDSIFGNVHVPTDLLLRDVLENIGFNFSKEIYLRTRFSKKRKKLKQVLMIFKVD